ncbi:MAG: ExbD/TolR family protein, partial [Planctomycetota bacterium]
MSTLKARKLRRKGAAPKWGDVLAPLLDVIFLLVIFLLVTASFDDRQLIDVQLPQARGDSNASPQEKEESGLLLVLLKDGSIRWQDDVFTLEELTPLLAQLPEETPIQNQTQVVTR